MKRKIAIISMAALICLSTASCSNGIPQEEHESVKTELANLQSEHEELKKEKESVESDLKTVKTEYESYKKKMKPFETASTQAPKETEIPKETEKPAEAQKETEKKADVTIGQKNALSKAASYLKYSSFSYTGLIEQLEFEGFSNEDATYAVDNCGADWNEQAAKKAQSYLDYSSFSRSGLIDQLEFEGFTSEQAEYGVTAVGY